MKKIIKRAHEKRVSTDENQEEELIRVRDDILEQLQNTAYESSKCKFTLRKEEWMSHSLAQVEVKA